MATMRGASQNCFDAGDSSPTPRRELHRAWIFRSWPRAEGSAGSHHDKRGRGIGA